MDITVTQLPAKLLIRSPLAPDCDFELRVERDPTSEEWDILFEYLTICRRSADRKSGTAHVNANEPKTTPEATKERG